MGGGQDAGEGQRDGDALPAGVHIGALAADQRVEAGAFGLEPALDHVEVVAEGVEDDGFLEVGLEGGQAVDAVLAGELAGPQVAGVALVVAEVDQQRLAELIADEAERIHGGVLHVAPGELAGLVGVPVGVAHPASDLPFGDLSRNIAVVVDTRFECPQRVQKLGECAVRHDAPPTSTQRSVPPTCTARTQTIIVRYRTRRRRRCRSRIDHTSRPASINERRHRDGAIRRGDCRRAAADFSNRTPKKNRGVRARGFVDPCLAAGARASRREARRPSGDGVRRLPPAPRPFP